MVSNSELTEFFKTGQWQQIVEATANLSGLTGARPGHWFFRGAALLKLAQLPAAIEAIERGLVLDANSSWGNKLLFETLCRNNQKDQAVTGLTWFMVKSQQSEADKAWFVQAAVNLGHFEQACVVNETRSVIVDVPPTPRYALALQCFCKVDTLQRVFETLMELTDTADYGLVILQDSVIGSSKADRYAAGALLVQELIGKWLAKLNEKFFSVEYLRNDHNLGTAPSCRRLLDHVCRKYDGFLFIEDDCLLTPSALAWTSYHIKQNLSPENLWFVSCESIFFNREERPLGEETLHKLTAISRMPMVRCSYILVDFVPSTCFATTSGIWQRAAPLRSCTLGPETLNHYIKAHSIKTILPVVPHASDIGMLHELGYSVAHHGVENVRERKETYLLAQGAFDPASCQLYPANKDLLYSATSKLVESSILHLEKQVLGS
jgi:hypothetical protein